MSLRVIWLSFYIFISKSLADGLYYHLVDQTSHSIAKLNQIIGIKLGQVATATLKEVLKPFQHSLQVVPFGSSF